MGGTKTRSNSRFVESHPLSSPWVAGGVGHAGFIDPKTAWALGHSWVRLDISMVDDQVGLRIGRLRLAPAPYRPSKLTCSNTNGESLATSSARME